MAEKVPEVRLTKWPAKRSGSEHAWPAAAARAMKTVFEGKSFPGFAAACGTPALE